MCSQFAKHSMHVIVYSSAVSICIGVMCSQFVKHMMFWVATSAVLPLKEK